MSATTFQEKYEYLIKETSVNDWDDVGGHAIPEWVWQERVYRIAFWARMLVPNLPDPHPSASGDGTVYLRWARGKAVVDFETARDGSMSVMWRLRGKSHSEQIDNEDRLFQVLRTVFSVESVFETLMLCAATRWELLKDVFR